MHAEWGTLSAKAADRIAATGMPADALSRSHDELPSSRVRGRDRRGPALCRRNPTVHHARLPFLVIDMLLTNFHLPRSTLLCWSPHSPGSSKSRRLRARGGRRLPLFSYGDACLIERTEGASEAAILRGISACAQ